MSLDESTPLVQPSGHRCGDGHFASIAYRDLPLDVDYRICDLPAAVSATPIAGDVASATALPFRRPFNTAV
jgi:hypothetical protein